MNNESDYNYKCGVCNATFRIIMPERLVQCCPVCGDKEIFVTGSCDYALSEKGVEE